MHQGVGVSPYQVRREEELFDQLGFIKNEQAEFRDARPLEVASSKNVMALGYKAGKGFFKRTGKNFEIHEIYFAAQIQTQSSSNYQLLGGAGYEMQKLYIDPELGDKLKDQSTRVKFALLLDRFLTKDGLKAWYVTW